MASFQNSLLGGQHCPQLPINGKGSKPVLVPRGDNRTVKPDRARGLKGTQASIDFSSFH